MSRAKASSRIADSVEIQLSTTLYSLCARDGKSQHAIAMGQSSGSAGDVQGLWAKRIFGRWNGLYVAEAPWLLPPEGGTLAGRFLKDFAPEYRLEPEACEGL